MTNSKNDHAIHISSLFPPSPFHHSYFSHNLLSPTPTVLGMIHVKLGAVYAPFACPAPDGPEPRTKWRLMALVKDAALLPPRFSVVSSGRCGRPRRRRRSMDQKTRVAVKYRSNMDHGYYFGVPICVHRSATSPSPCFHAFPSPISRPQVRGPWIHAIRRDRSKDFKVTSNTRVCCAHFRESDCRVSAYAGTAAAPIELWKRNLVPNAVPSLFEWNSSLHSGLKPRLRRSSTHCHLRIDAGEACRREVGGDSNEHGESSNVPVAVSSNVSDAISLTNTSPPSPSPPCSGATASVDHDYLPVLACWSLSESLRKKTLR